MADNFIAPLYLRLSANPCSPYKHVLSIPIDRVGVDYLESEIYIKLRIHLIFPSFPFLIFFSKIKISRVEWL